MKKISENKCFGGSVQVWEHASRALNCDMKFSIFLPSQAAERKVPLITFLSGLTCTHENFTTKSGAYQRAAELGLAILAPDTSPRGDEVPDDADSYDFGKGAGFYINATSMPWTKHYKMENYIVDELYTLIPENFPVDGANQSIMGHSMGGHGALTLYLKHHEQYQSTSAFSPIVAPASVPWGKKAFERYLGSDTTKWVEHDASELVKKNPQETPILIDQGLDDQFLEEQLKPDIFESACKDAGQPLTLRKHAGYDHSYYFIQTFINDHLDHHVEYLTE
tara:strand:+ start:3703 stop:4539 length:837 start_codon:yes stop_codon:yes gene_type:complete